MPATKLPSIDEQRAALRSAAFEAPRKYRIVFVGRFFQGATGIVASLHRALEGLGHTVFELEPAKHKDSLDASSGAKGGYGPVFFRPEAVAPIFETFDPEIVVFCAGGVVLDESGREWFRARGIATIGLTLSDPDVQDSVIGFVDNFDFHTTNAALALDRYLEAGHRNTFLMPFGIDRDFVLREVPPAPELAADAICIGHAAGRPDRHEVMTNLAERVDVRVYGNGWPLPGAEPVSGDRLLQAAHEGTVHVNFPATRAGFTNVKCGVFETIGAGAILATSRFDEMGALFEYGDEILGYDGADDLAQQIVELKADPERLEHVRRAGFRRLLSEHLYEHRWLQLFEQIEHDLEDEHSSRPPEDRERLRAILAREHGRPRHVIISGFYGAQNRGDDLLLDAIAGSLRRADPDTNVVVAAVQPREVERSGGYQAFKRTDAHVAERYASMATSIILGAGGLWHDYTIARAGGVAGIVTGAAMSPSHLVQLPLMTKAYGGSFHVYGMGVGPLTDEAAKASVRLTGSLAASVTVRDEKSLRLLDDVRQGWAATPVIAPDAVYSLDMRPAEPSIALPERYIALNVRPWEDDQQSVRLRDAVLAVAARLGIPVVALPMQPIDDKVLANGDAEAAYSARVPSGLGGDEFLGVIDRAAVVVSMRLHANLLAHRLGVPAVGFSYDEKVRSHFGQLGRDASVLDLDATEEEIEAAILRALEEQRLPEAVAETVRTLEAQSRAAIDAVAAEIASAPLQISPIAGMPHEGLKPEKPQRKEKGASIAEDLIWPSDTSLRLDTAVVTSGNLLDRAVEVPHKRRTNRRGDSFEIDARAPRLGDYAQWAIPLATTPGEGVRVELWIQQKYRERQKFAGHLAYSVLLDGKVLFTQDITDWQPRNSVWVAFTPTSEKSVLKVRLHALRNCPDWGWGAATTLTIERGRTLPWPESGELVWGASSPAAVRHAVREAVERAVDLSEQGELATAAAVAPAAAPARRSFMTRVRGRLARAIRPHDG